MSVLEKSFFYQQILREGEARGEERGRRETVLRRHYHRQT